jgi:PHD/YefM family antitoxin component YafN of YafNO toxin-antitoxin module
MFDLNKIIDIIKETGREIFLAKENKETLVLMSVDRYRELIGKDNSINNTVDSARDIKEKDYPDYVQKTIMPEMGIDE